MIIKSRRSWVEQILVAIGFLIVYLGQMLLLQRANSLVFAVTQLIFGGIILLLVYIEVGTFKVTVQRPKFTTNLKIWLVIFGLTVIAILWLEDWPSTVMATLTSQHLVQNTLVALATGIVEECLTRGLLVSALLQNLRRHNQSLKITKAAVYSSLIFGSLHMMNIFSGSFEGVAQQVLYSFVFGMLLMVIRVTTNTLIWSIGLHFLIDWQPDIANATSGTSNWFSIIVVFGFILVVSLICLIKFDRNLEHQSGLNSD
ncbi:CPBP family intramembrane glutamic endopeptidase [Lentilactobacillus kisonensis]|uniref:CAAX amino terminal protease family protein n=2 Tax=Lentilactobacillus kisonensis TaxID=481722 RepID=H1LFD6_9LACO|nr:CPBP family intramembrane glutamic endopeptidase [Lentilactobacillus kisonensis]EHO51846.1 CAAX amino terminal protease family protein [Lentilactobacillus kisonensis F0435]KRL22085.1 CAAX amino terminal protease family protein [Lentilactobacillus kisonensis DSM 19906 = JCM 15041]